MASPTPRVARDRRRRAKRFAALAALGLFVALYAGPVRSLLHAREQAASLRAEVHRLDAQGKRLRAELDALRSDAAMIALARESGYIFPGETPFVAHLGSK